MVDLADSLRAGAVAVIPTDTLYGLVALATDKEAVERVYALKKRTPTKPCIILISSIDELQIFGVSVDEDRLRVLNKYWPGPVSIILPCDKTTPEYLHRGTYTLAFRLPSDAGVLALVAASGPLIAPSANPEGLPPATTIDEAKAYFGDAVDVYIDGGVRSSKSSTLLIVDEAGEVTVVRR